MTERRSGAGRRAGEEKVERRVLPEARTGGKRKDDPPAAREEQREEVEPDRRHFLHRQLGKKKTAA